MDFKIYLTAEYQEQRDHAPLEGVVQAESQWKAIDRAREHLNWDIAELTTILCTNGEQVAREAGVPYID